uniref:Uncharacterized protein n=1 Tax=Ditylenchus dipsaci TaxID=166011 RepID=A0A915DSS2_9BILA
CIRLSKTGRNQVYCISHNITETITTLKKSGFSSYTTVAKWLKEADNAKAFNKIVFTIYNSPEDEKYYTELVPKYLLLV